MRRQINDPYFASIVTATGFKESEIALWSNLIENDFRSDGHDHSGGQPSPTKAISIVSSNGEKNKNPKSNVDENGLIVQVYDGFSKRLKTDYSPQLWKNLHLNLASSQRSVWSIKQSKKLTMWCSFCSNRGSSLMISRLSSCLNSLISQCRKVTVAWLTLEN